MHVHPTTVHSENSEISNQAKSKSIHATVRAFILFGFAILFAQLGRGHTIEYFIAPRMLPFFYIATISFFLLSISQLFRILSISKESNTVNCDCGHSDHTHGNRARFWFYGLFALPLLTGFILPHTSLDSSVVAKRGVQVSFDFPPAANNGKLLSVKNSDSSLASASAAISNEIKAAAATSQSITPVITPAESVKSQPKETDRILPIAASKIKSSSETDLLKKTEANTPVPTVSPDKAIAVPQQPNEVIFNNKSLGPHLNKLAQQLYLQNPVVIDKSNFVDAVKIISAYPNEFKCKKIEASGFVYRGEQAEQGEFVLARFAVQCCTADARAYGINVSGNDEFNDDTWVHIKGQIGQKIMGTSAVPSIEIDQINKIDKPEDPYVYPTY